MFLFSQIILLSGVNPRNLELEITESLTIDDSVKTVSILEQFKQLGLSISIDDFGTGFSSLSYLQQYPIDNLKIDQVFIKDIPFNKSSISIAKAIIALGHSLDMKVIAEGVETIEQYKLLEEFECNVVQGFLISKPLPADELVEFVKTYKGQSSIKIKDI